MRTLVNKDHRGSNLGVNLHVKLSNGDIDQVEWGKAHDKNGSGIRVHREKRVSLNKFDGAPLK